MTTRDPAKIEVEGMIRSSQMIYGPHFGDQTYEHTVISLDGLGREYEMEFQEICKAGTEPSFKMGMRVTVTIVEKVDCATT